VQCEDAIAVSPTAELGELFALPIELFDEIESRSDVELTQCRERVFGNRHMRVHLLNEK
jgi:hypothetical protein